MTKFKLTKEHLYWWPVEIKVPDPDPKKAGTFQKQRFKMEFLALPKDEADALAEEIAALPEAEQAKRQHDHMIRVCRNWDEDVVDADDNPIPFSEEALREAMQVSWFRIGLYRSYNRSLIGDEARLGN